MAQVVCQVLAHPGRITFRWSEGERCFEPYYLEGDAVQLFWKAARDVRAALGPLAQREAAAALDLARAGHRLYEWIFPEHSSFGELTGEIRNWLSSLSDKGKLHHLEITGDTVGLIPWQAIYDQVPEEAAFQRGGDASWRPFWGNRYALGATHRFNPLRGVGPLIQPEILLAVDADVQNRLTDDEQDELEHFTLQHSLTILRDPEQLASALKTSAPDVLILLCASDRSGLKLGGSSLWVDRLRDWLGGSASAQTPWNNLLVMLHSCGEAGDGWSSQRDQLQRLRLAGLITPDQPVTPSLAVRCLLDFADGWLSKGDIAGLALQNVRSSLSPAGLVYGGYLPPQLQATLQESSASENKTEASSATEELPLPADPYHPLVPLDREERALLVGRDHDIAGFCEVIDTPGLRLALLHGRPGVGKASLLRAGVIPCLVDEAHGYLPLRDRSEKDTSIESEKDYPIVALRAGNDLLAQLAPALAVFASRPYLFSTPTGRKVSIDLKTILAKSISASPSSTAITTKPTDAAQIQPEGQHVSTPGAAPRTTGVSPERIYSYLSQDREALARLLLALSEQLPAEPLLVVEQAEELFSLSKTAADVQYRQRALAMLQVLAEATGHAKVILSLTTAYFGRLVARLHAQGETRSLVGNYLLAALNADQLTEVLLRPTQEEPPAYCSESPAQKYAFRFEGELPRQIAREAIQAVNDGKEESLPLVHAVGALLHQQLANRQNKIITAGDLKRIGVVGALGKYVDQLVAALVRPTEKKHLWQILESMSTRQADGLLTRIVLADQELAQRWRGATPMQQIIATASAPGVGLLDERAAVTDRGEQVLVSLGHDVLAPVIEQRQQLAERKQVGRARIADTLWVCIPIMILMALGTYTLFMRPYFAAEEKLAKTELAVERFVKQQEEELKQQKKDLQLVFYPAQMALAQQAWQQGDWLRLQQTLTGLQADARTLDSFEWRYLWQQAQGSRWTLGGHQSPITTVAVSKDGQVLLSAGEDDSVRMWNVAKGQGVSIKLPDEALGLPALTNPDGSVHAAALAPGGKRCALAGAAGAIRVWDLTFDKDMKSVSLKQRHKFSTGDKGLRALVFAGDDVLVAVNYLSEVLSWDMAKGEEKQVPNEHKAEVTHLIATEDGKTMATADSDGKVILWQRDGFKKLYTLDAKAPITGLAFAPDGGMLAALVAEANSSGGSVRFWETASGKEGPKALKLPNAGLAVAFGADEKTVWTAGKDRIISAWDVAGGKLQRQLRGHTGWVTSLAVDRAGKNLISGAYDAQVKVWDLTPLPDAITGHDGAVTSVSFSPDSKLLATGGADGVVKLWDMKTRTEKHALKGHDGPVRSVALARVKDKEKDRLFVASGSDGSDSKPGKVLLWEIEGDKPPKEAKEFKGHKASIHCVALMSDAKFLAGAGADGTVRLWDPADGKEKFNYQKHKGAVRAVTFYPKIPIPVVASGGDEGHVHIWFGEDGSSFLSQFNELPAAELESFAAKLQVEGAITSLVFLPYNAKHLAAGSSNGVVGLWDLNRAKQVATLFGHSGAVAAVAGNKDGHTLFSGGQDGTLRLWNVHLGAGVFALRDHSGPIHGVAISPDQRTLASVGADGKIRFYEAAPWPAENATE